MHLPDHPELREEDECYFLGDYTAGAGYGASDMNSLIFNLKKKPSESGRPGYSHKATSIREASEMLRAALNPDGLKGATLVPVPGSKALGDPDFDDRMERICRGIAPGLDVRSLVRQRETTRASHVAGSGNRVTVAELRKVYEIDESQATPEASDLWIFDDVLTNGTHYRAMHGILSHRFPDASIKGVFIARTVHP